MAELPAVHRLVEGVRYQINVNENFVIEGTVAKNRLFEGNFRQISLKDVEIMKGHDANLVIDNSNATHIRNFTVGAIPLHRIASPWNLCHPNLLQFPNNRIALTSTPTEVLDVNGGRRKRRSRRRRSRRKRRTIKY